MGERRAVRGHLSYPIIRRAALLRFGRELSSARIGAAFGAIKARNRNWADALPMKLSAAAGARTNATAEAFRPYMDGQGAYVLDFPSCNVAARRQTFNVRASIVLCSSGLSSKVWVRCRPASVSPSVASIGPTRHAVAAMGALATSALELAVGELKSALGATRNPPTRWMAVALDVVSIAHQGIKVLAERVARGEAISAALREHSVERALSTTLEGLGRKATYGGTIGSGRRLTWFTLDLDAVSYRPSQMRRVLDTDHVNRAALFRLDETAKSLDVVGMIYDPQAAPEVASTAAIGLVRWIGGRL